VGSLAFPGVSPGLHRSRLRKGLTTAVVHKYIFDWTG